MKAITFQGVSDVRAETVADPKIVDATDIVVRITTSAVCGSDLHQYHGRGGGALVQKGAIMGHEFMGVVEEAGAAVRTVRAGDRVVLPFNVSCGACEWCRRKLPSQCATTGRAVFGGRFGHVWGGGQAERVRVPFADHLCEKVDASLSDDDALFLGDILSFIIWPIALLLGIIMAVVLVGCAAYLLTRGPEPVAAEAPAAA